MDNVDPPCQGPDSAARATTTLQAWCAGLRRLGSRHVAALAAAVVLVSLAVAVFGPGQPDDEGEHLHAAYLIGGLGERPHVDFFQHHPALLWTVLSPVFRFGPVSPTAAVFAGRGLVVALLLATWLGLGCIARGGHERRLAVVNGAGLIVAFTVTIYPEALALRPETLGLPLVVWGWSLARDRHLGAALAGGCLAGMACDAAPRFLTVLPVFAIPSLLHRGDRDWKHLATVLAGCIAGFVAAAAASGQHPSEMLFNIHFSALLQKIGTGSSTQVPSMAAVLICLFLFLRHVLPAEFRNSREYPAWEGAAWLAFAVGAFSAWPFLYGQALVPLVTVCAIMVAQAESVHGRSSRLQAAVVVGAAAAAILVSAAVTFATGSTVHHTLAWRESLAAAMRHDDTILMRSRLHPIVAQDASFYPVPLIDSQRRTTHAMRAAGRLRTLPPLDYAADIRRRRPRLVDSTFVLEALPDAAPDFLGWVESNYEQVNRVLLVRRDTAADDLGTGLPAAGLPANDR